MSLVAYAASSDEESDNEEVKSPILQTKVAVPEKLKPSSSEIVPLNGYISDEDDEFTPVEVGLKELKKTSLSLPPPKKQTISESLHDDMDDDVTPTFAKLPMPRDISTKNTEIIEEDDEFLHKKAVPIPDSSIEKPPPVAKGPVRITIPSLKEFSDVDKELAQRAKNKIESVKAPKGSGLLSILPKAKSEQDFSKTASSTPTPLGGNTDNSKKVTSLIPDSVKTQRPAKNTEGVDGIKSNKKRDIKTDKPKIALVDCSDSEGSDNESGTGGDFFSLNTDEKLPEISTNEINIMVAKRAAQMAETTNKYLNSMTTSNPQEEEQHIDEEAMREAQKRYHSQQSLDAQAVQALVGSSAKRRRKHEEIHVMDISSDQVLPDREEWMRTALATSTAYQPTGVLTDEEPASGTRRKHQITYLAHKAKANEAELQAMWAANRNTRRATQSKYGF